MFIIILVLSFLGICVASMAMEQQDPEFDVIAKNYQLIKNLCSDVSNLRQNIKNAPQHPTAQRWSFGTQMTEGKYSSIYNNPIPNALFFEHALKYLFMSRLQAQPEELGRAYSLVKSVWDCLDTRVVFEDFRTFVHDYTLKTFETYLETNQLTKAHSLRQSYRNAIDTTGYFAHNYDHEMGLLDRVKEKVKLRLDDLAKECVLNAHIQQEREDTARNLIGLMPLDLQAEYESHFDRRKVEFTTLPEDAVVLRLQRQLEERLFGNQ